MNKEIVDGKWTELKGKIRERWGKLTDDDVESFRGNMDQISGKIQQTYGYAKDRAEKEYADFQVFLNNDDKGNRKTSTSALDRDRDRSAPERGERRV